jgi:hypothetical protein
MGPARGPFLLMVSGGNAAKRKGQGSGDQPGPNNRALTTGGDDPKGGAILKITFAGLVSCSNK